MLSECHVLIADFHKISIGNVKKLLLNFFDKREYVFHYENWLGLKFKKCIAHLEPYVKFSTKRRIEAEKNDGKDGKVLYKLMNDAIYGKTLENLRNRFDVKLVNNIKDDLKWTSNQAI